MAELQPDQKIERKDLAVMGVAAQHQVDLSLRPLPDRRLVDEGKVEGALARHLFNNSSPRRHRLLVAHPDQVDAEHLRRCVFKHIDVQFGKPRQQPLEPFHIPLMIAGDEMDVRIQRAECRDVLQFEIAAVEQVTTDQKRIEFQSVQPLANLLQMARRVGADMHIADEGEFRHLSDLCRLDSQLPHREAVCIDNAICCYRSKDKEPCHTGGRTVNTGKVFY